MEEQQKIEARRKAMKKYKKQMNSIAKKVNAESKTVVEMLIDRVSYLAAYLDELQEDTIVGGVVVPYNNGGGQSGMRVHPNVNVYTAYAKQFTASVKQLQGFLDNLQPEEKDELQLFMEKFK